LLLAAPLAFAQGTYTLFDVPGSLATYATGINSAGDVVGYYVDSSGNFNGFVLSAGSYTTITYPGATVTHLFGINDNNQIVGTTPNPDIGFLYDEQTNTFTTIKYP